MGGGGAPKLGGGTLKLGMGGRGVGVIVFYGVVVFYRVLGGPVGVTVPYGVMGGQWGGSGGGAVPYGVNGGGSLFPIESMGVAVPYGAAVPSVATGGRCSLWDCSSLRGHRVALFSMGVNGSRCSLWTPYSLWGCSSPCGHWGSLFPMWPMGVTVLYGAN